MSTAPAPWSEVAAAELAFAKAAQDVGMRHAFTSWLAPDGLLFRPAPTVGQSVWQPREESPALLWWQPSWVAASASGDMGFTTGPWSFYPERGGEAAGHGHFVTVWERQPGGEFKIALDLGVDHAAPAVVEPPVDPARPPARVEPGRPGDVASLRSMEARLARKVGRRGPQVMADVLSGEGRVLRPGAEPAAAQGAEALLAQTPMPGWEVQACEVAAAGDLGYTWGPWTGDGASGWYVHFWRREQGRWALVLDIALVTPPPPAP